MSILRVWQMRPVTPGGELDFELDSKGQIVEDESAATLVENAIRTEPWWANLDGSRLPEYMRQIPLNGASEIEGAVRDALRVWTDRNRLQALAVVVELDGTRVNVKLTAFDARANIPVRAEVIAP